MKITVDGGSVAFEDSGAGPVLLLLHAFPLSSAMWEGLAAAVAGRHRVVGVDARGFGGSDPAAGPLAMERIARDAAAVLDHLGERTAVVAGASMGGYAAFALARLLPARVRGLVLAGTKAAPDTDEGRAGRAKLADKVRAEGAPALEEAMMPKLLGATSHRERPELVARVRGWVRQAGPEAAAQALAGLGARPDARPWLRDIHVPALIVRGDEDAVTTTEDVREMRAGLFGSRVLAIPGAGHLPNLETPQVFDAALHQFLEENKNVVAQTRG